MRLKKEEIEAIKSSVHLVDPDAKIILFGSRAQPDKKGGDIDLLILSKTLKYDDQLAIKRHLFKKIEEQKVDIVITNDTDDPFIQIALKTGIEL